MLEIVLFFLALLVVATPFLALYLLTKVTQLRREVDILTNEKSRQNSSLWREINELKQRIAERATQEAESTTARAISAQQTPTVLPDSKTAIPPAPVTIQSNASPNTEKKKDEPVPASPSSAPIFTANSQAEKSAESSAAQPKGSVGATAESVKAASTIAHQQMQGVTSTTVPPEQPTATTDASARIATPSVAPLRISLPSQTVQQQRMAKVSSIEEALGTNWLNKLGIVILVVGVALFGIYELGTLGPLGKAGISFATSLTLLASGVFFEKRERYRLLGHTGIGGGWALLFFSTYAINHIAAMRVVSSETADLILMLIVALGMTAHTLRYKSQFVTGLAFLLGYTTVALSHDNVYSLSAGTVLAIGLVAVVIKMDWFEFEIFGILSSYLNHWYWLYRILGIDGANGHHFEAYRASTAILLFYWVIFRSSYVLRRIKSDSDEHISSAAALLNTLLLLLLMRFQSVQPQLAYIALFVIGVLEFSLAQLPMTKRRREAFVVLSVIGAALMLAAVPFHYSGNNVSILWLVGAEAFLLVGIPAREPVFRRLGLAAGILVGAHLAFVDFRQLIALRTTTEALALAPGVLFILSGIVFYLNALAVKARWPEMFEDDIDPELITAHSYIGAFAATAAAWALFSNDWTALAFAAVMFTLAALTRQSNSFHLQVQYGLVGAATMYRILTSNLHLESPNHVHVKMRLLTLPVLGAVFYLTAKLAQLRDDFIQRVFRGVFAAAGSTLFGLLIWFEVPDRWQACAFVMFAVLLAQVGRKIRYRTIIWQANVAAVCAFLQAILLNFDVPQEFWHGISLRILSVSLAAAGFYVLSRCGAPDERFKRVVAFLYSFVGTGLLALLAWHEVPNGWLAPLWVAFAFALIIIDRRFQVEELPWQAHALALLTVLRSITVNLHVTATWYGISVRLLSLALVALTLYTISGLVRMPQEWRARNIHHIYSFSASTIVSLLLWYELQPLSVAVGWAVFGLVLFEYGILRKIAQLRYQAYIALVASFARIFFVNLATGEAGDFSDPRMYTISPIALILFFVYAQPLPKDEPISTNQDLHLNTLIAYLGTTTIVALFYFQFPIEWVVTSWAAVVFLLLGAALVLNRPIFLHQGLLLTVGALARGWFTTCSERATLLRATGAVVISCLDPRSHSYWLA